MCYLVGVSPSEICKWCMTKINLIVVTKTFVILVSLDKIRFHPKYLFFSFPDTLLPSRHGATRERHGGVQCLHHVARAILQRVSKPALHPPAGDQGSGSVLCFKCCSRQPAYSWDVVKIACWCCFLFLKRDFLSETGERRAGPEHQLSLLQDHVRPYWQCRVAFVIDTFLN